MVISANRQARSTLPALRAPPARSIPQYRRHDPIGDFVRGQPHQRRHHISSTSRFVSALEDTAQVCAGSDATAVSSGMFGSTEPPRPAAPIGRFSSSPALLLRLATGTRPAVPLKAPLILIGIYCGLGGCDFLASALLFITG